GSLTAHGGHRCDGHAGYRLIRSIGAEVWRRFHKATPLDSDVARLTRLRPTPAAWRPTLGLVAVAFAGGAAARPEPPAHSARAGRWASGRSRRPPPPSWRAPWAPRPRLARAG